MPRKFTYLVLAFICLSSLGPLLAWALVKLLATMPASDRFGLLLFALALCVTAGSIAFGIMAGKLGSLTPGPRSSTSIDKHRRRPPRPEHHPKEFTERLAGYLHRDPKELAEPRPYAESNMSFWSRVGQLRWFGPKPAYLIRRLLERIRAQVHGRAH